MKKVVSKENTKLTWKKRLKKQLPTLLTVFVCALVMFGTTAFAAGTTTAESMWNSVMNLMKTWVLRLGLVVVFIGAIMFGLGFKNDDAEAKTRGVNTMVAGAIVAAATTLVTNLLVP